MAVGRLHERYVAKPTLLDSDPFLFSHRVKLLSIHPTRYSLAIGECYHSASLQIGVAHFIITC